VLGLWLPAGLVPSYLNTKVTNNKYQQQEQQQRLTGRYKLVLMYVIGHFTATQTSSAGQSTGTTQLPCMHWNMPLLLQILLP
jgi:hypothetical protein